jgi:uncharacterized protein
MYEWFINEWVHIVVIHPESGEFLYFRDGRFSKYAPITKQPESLNDIHSFLESSKKMETNETVDATRENLPVYLLN